MVRRMLVTVMAAAAGMAAPAVAQAGTLGYYDVQGATYLVFQAQGGEGSVIVVGDDSDPAWMKIGKDAVAGTPPAECQESFPDWLRCPIRAGIVLFGSDGPERFTASDLPAGTYLEMLGEGGDDQLQESSDGLGSYFDGGAGRDEIDAGDGDDELRGGDGPDELEAGGGADRLYGEGGDDHLIGDPSNKPAAPDVIDGGEGFDKAGEWSEGTATGIVVTLDGVADDGRAGEGDNVVAVEHLATFVGGRYVGTDAAERYEIISGAGDAASDIQARGGDDHVTASGGSERIDGGAGADTLTGGFNNDTITGGPGPDTIFADTSGSYCSIWSCQLPYGNDTVDVRDGEVDSVDCGVGADRVIADRADVIAGNCETVERGGPDDEDGQDEKSTAAKLAGVSGKRSLRRLAGKGLAARVSCATACGISADLLVDKRTARRLGLGKARRIGGGRRELAAAGTATVPLKATAKVKRRLKRLRSATLTLRIRVKGADDATATLTRRLRLGR